MENETPVSPSVKEDIIKFWLAIVFLTLCLGGIVSLSIVLIKANKEEKEAAAAIFNSILPLLGAWVGAILAYYFGTKQIEVTQQQQSRALDMMSRQVEHHRSLAENAQTMLQAQLTQAQAGK